MLPIATGSTTARVSSRPLRDAPPNKRSRSKENRLEKRGSKNSSTTLLTRALSQIAQDRPDINVADVTAFAKRSVETRRGEAAKAGKVKRPLNAFMLYRKAYQDVAKTQCSRNNHQQVSTICGSSWNGWEPQTIIAHFKELASIEKQMHEGAFPAYKYDPVQAKKPREALNHDSTAVCDVSDGESGCHPKRSGRHRSTRSISRSRQPFDLGVTAQQLLPPSSHPQFLDSSWQPYQAPLFPEWYSQGSLASDLGQYMVRGGSQQATDSLDMSLPYVCAPSDLHFQPYPAFLDPCIDPSLNADVSGSQYGQFLRNSHDMLTDWTNVDPGNTTLSLVPDLDAAGAHNAYLQGTEGDWMVEQLEDGSHFSDWMTQTGHASQ